MAVGEAASVLGSLRCSDFNFCTDSATDHVGVAIDSRGWDITRADGKIDSITGLTAGTIGSMTTAPGIALGLTGHLGPFYGSGK